MLSEFSVGTPSLTDGSKKSKFSLQMFSTMLRKFSESASFGTRGKFVLGVAIVLCGLSSLAMAQGTPVPKSVTTDQRNAPSVAADQTNTPGVVSCPQPPTGFDPLTASDKELKRYGFPPRPDPEKAPEAYSPLAKASVGAAHRKSHIAADDNLQWSRSTCTGETRASIRATLSLDQRTSVWILRSRAHSFYKLWRL